MTFPDSDSLDNYGGAKVNYAPIVDYTTDRDADQINRALCSVAAMTRPAIRAWARLTLGANPALVNPNGSDAAWGNLVPPLPLKTATGVWTLTWPATVTDELQAQHTTFLRWAAVMLEGATFAGFVRHAVTSANVVTLYGFNTSFTANDLTGSTVTVIAG